MPLICFFKGLKLARRVFYSFHFGNDIFRANVVRNTWTFESPPVVDPAGWEEIKRGGDREIQSWIDKAMSGCGVTVVLIGQETAHRRWVQYEIAKSYDDKKGVIGICLRGIKDFDQKSFSDPGPNPWAATRNTYGGKYLIPNYPIYSWKHNNGRENFESWVERAATQAGR